MNFSSLKSTNSLIFTLIVCLLIFCVSSSFKPSGKVFFPFKIALHNYDSLIVERSQKLPYSKCRHCIVDKPAILKLSELVFFDKQYEVGKLGVTPDGSVSFYNNGQRILLIGIWEINKDRYAINFNMEKEGKGIYGAVIEKSKMDSAFGEIYKK